MSLELVRLTDRPQLKEQAAQWFHQKWGVPLAAYQESMEQCLSARSPVPQWYLAMEGERIVGGMGVIENDFHDRKDLSPNVCAVYTEPDCRTTPPSMSDTAGSFSAWRRGTGRRSRPEFTGIKHNQMKKEPDEGSFFAPI